MENNNLKKYIDNFFNDIELYDDYRNGHNYKGLLKSSIDMFLDYSSVFNAIRVYEMFFGIYQITSEDKSSAGRYGDNNIEPNIILDIIELFLKYENKVNINFSVPIHSVNVFIMGLAIYSQNNSYRDVFKEYVLSSPYKKYYKDMDNEFSNEEFLYRWGITSLLFDLAMPVELLSKPLKKRMTDEINSVFENYDELNHINLADIDESNFIPKINYDFADNYRSHYYNSKFLDLFKPTEVMAHRISENFRFNNEQMRLLTNHLDNFVDYMEENEFIDHGFVSSVLTLNFYGYLIQKYRKNHDFFFYPVVDSASAILLHNYYRNILQRNPFNLGSLFIQSHPLAFLLILCDEIQHDNGEASNSFAKSYISTIEISDKNLDIEYILKNAFGFNHSKYKEEFIRHSLNVETCFLRGIRIFDRYSVEKDENNLRDILKSEIQPANTSIRTVEKLANQLHQSYIDSVTAQYEEEKSKGEVNEWTKQRYEWLTPFEELSSQLIMANIRQAESIPKKLNFIGCEIAELSDEREAITNFSDDETLDLAICEHERWCEEKISQGWTYGEVRDNDNLIHDCLVPWDELSPEIQQYDIDLVKEIPALVESCGFKIVKNKISLLCLEIIKYQDDEFSLLQTGDFSGNNRYINFIQTNNLIKTLSKRGYSIKDLSDDRKPILEFGVDERDLASRQHEEWCKIKFSLGWNYGSKNDNEEKTSPYLVDWYDLDVSKQNHYINIIRNLPKICNEVGLKIIKN